MGMEAPGAGTCCNMSMTLGQGEDLLVGPSAVAGWGAFTRNSVDRNAFLVEYTGELISQGEADRRGQVYDHRA